MPPHLHLAGEFPRSHRWKALEKHLDDTAEPTKKEDEEGDAAPKSGGRRRSPGNVARRSPRGGKNLCILLLLILLVCGQAQVAPGTGGGEAVGCAGANVLLLPVCPEERALPLLLPV